MACFGIKQENYANGPQGGDCGAPQGAIGMAAITDTYTIRDARPDDAAPLAALKLACFRETFGPTGYAIPYPEADLAVFEANA